MDTVVETKAESEIRRQQEQLEAQRLAVTGGKKPKNTFKIMTIVLGVLVLGLGAVVAVLAINEVGREECPICEENTEPPVLKVEGGPYITDGYFTVPAWNVKFKLSDDLTDYGFAVLPNSLASSYGNYVVGMTAVFKKDLDENAQYRYYATIDYCSFVTVSRTTSNMKDVEGPKKVVLFNSYNYVIYDFRAHGGCVDGGAGLMTAEYFSKVADKLADIFSNPENLNVGFTNPK